MTLFNQVLFQVDKLDYLKNPSMDLRAFSFRVQFNEITVFTGYSNNNPSVRLTKRNNDYVVVVIAHSFISHWGENEIHSKHRISEWTDCQVWKFLHPQDRKSLKN